MRILAPSLFSLCFKEMYYFGSLYVEINGTASSRLSRMIFPTNWILKVKICLGDDFDCNFSVLVQVILFPKKQTLLHLMRIWCCLQKCFWFFLSSLAQLLAEDVRSFFESFA